MKQYYQCRMQNTTRTTTAWIEARGAKVGKVVELLPSKEKWMVMEVYSHGLPEDVLRQTQQLNRKSLPSVEPMG